LTWERPSERQRCGGALSQSNEKNDTDSFVFELGKPDCFRPIISGGSMKTSTRIALIEYLKWFEKG
jgi:hypothetical protein